MIYDLGQSGMKIFPHGTQSVQKTPQWGTGSLLPSSLNKPMSTLADGLEESSKGSLLT